MDRFRKYIPIIIALAAALYLAVFVRGEGDRQTDRLRRDAIRQCEERQEARLISNRRAKVLEEFGKSVIDIEQSAADTGSDPRLRATAADAAEHHRKLLPIIGKQLPPLSCDRLKED